MATRFYIHLYSEGLVGIQAKDLYTGELLVNEKVTPNEATVLGNLLIGAARQATSVEGGYKN